MAAPKARIVCVESDGHGGGADYRLEIPYQRDVQFPDADSGAGFHYKAVYSSRDLKRVIAHSIWREEREKSDQNAVKHEWPMELTLDLRPEGAKANV